MLLFSNFRIIYSSDYVLSYHFFVEFRGCKVKSFNNFHEAFSKMKIFTCLLTFIITSAFSSSSTSLNCDYHFGGLHLIGNVYRCIVKDNLNIFTEESAQITSVDGVHKDNRSTDDVAGFYASSKIVSYFPRNLDKYFPNMVSITIDSCHLLKIHQEDLKQFPKLVVLQLQHNTIEVIEQGLFDFNPKLKKISIYEKNLIHIDPNVFDNLPKLGYFTLNLLKCSQAHVYNSREKVRAAIQIVKSKCVNSDFVTLEKDIRHLDNQSKVLDYDDFNEKFIDFEMKYKNSKFLKFRPIRDIYVNLKYINDNEPTTPDNKVIEKVTEKININVETVTKPEYPTNQFLSDLQNISSNIDDLKNSQCGLKDILTDVKSSQDSLSTLFSELSVSQDEVGSSLEDIKSSVSNIESKPEWTQLVNI
ncbi:uncharacterized protein [Chironomus tepperi]|uniref:uncharacterized protein n=1 Tax=Chironomus tepperi TaxID=113505 RepID=UPI00391F8ADD